MWLLLVAASGVALLVFRWLLDRSRKPRRGDGDLPPGPRGLPLVGYSLGLKPLEQLDALTEEYGPVFTFHLLGKQYVHLGSYSAIREAYVKLGDCFAGRPRDSTAMGFLLDHQGISESEGHEWTEHRRFVLHTLRDFCFGKLSVLDRVQDAAHRLVGRVAAQCGRPFDPEPLIFEAVVATMAGLLFDVDYEDDDGVSNNTSSARCANDTHGKGRVNDDGEPQQTDEVPPADDATTAEDRAPTPVETEDEAHLARLVRLVAKATPLLSNDVLPQLWTCASPVELSPGFSELQRLKRELDEFLERMIAEHEPSLDESRLRDYMDVYLDERRRAMEEGTLHKSTFTIHRLKTICADLLVSGTASSSAQLCWALKLLARHPGCQRRCQDEMDAVLASADQLGSVFSKDNLPFTEACLLESARFASVHVVAAPRTNLDEATVGGFRIPAGSRVLANLWLAHRDPEFWREPHTFDPTRFLAEDGRPERKDAFLPFGLGKRICIGESLAKTQMFVFVTELLKRFTFTVPEEFATQDLNFRPSQGTLRFPEPFHLVATPKVLTTTL
ncbi:cytochrome P450 2D14-like [Dermacentor albipictus]|uniref:cytochrome P450 2D14-like n=1 Tax=Dermacentor albipictus TaxID=60249 RepID=UPI0031FC77F2